MCEVSTFEQAVHLTLNTISLHKAISRFFAYRGTGIGPDDFISVTKIKQTNTKVSLIVRFMMYATGERLG